MSTIDKLIGRFGRYQFWICFIVFLNKFGVAFHQMAIIFLAPPVKYTCAGAASDCCEHPVYDTSVFSNTIVMEWNLICGRSWLKDFTQTMFQFGVLIGSLLFGILSDKFGRRRALIAAIILEVLSGIVASFAPGYWYFSLMRVVVGVSVGGVMVVGFVIIIEHIGKDIRILISSLYHLPYAFGIMLLGLFGYYLRDYFYFQLAISVTNVLLLFYICFLPETPRWLLAKEMTDEAVMQIEKIATTNKMSTENIRENVQIYITKHKNDGRGSTMDVFRWPRLRRHICIMSLNWFTTGFCFYGLSQYIRSFPGSVFTGLIASGGVTIVAVAISIALMNFLGRKTIVIVSNAVCCICLLVIAILPVEGAVSVVFACLGVMFSFIAFIVMYLYCSEVFPTVVRNAAIGFTSLFARIGAMIAPFVAGLRHYGHWCAPLVFGIPPLISACFTILLPETKSCDLIMTIEEGEKLGMAPELTRQRIEDDGDVI